MDDRSLFAAAFEAQGDAPHPPPGFVDRVMGAAPRATAPPRWRRTLALAMAAVAVGALAVSLRPRSGEVTVGAHEAARQVSLGGRAVAVVEPGTTLRYRVAPWGESRVELARGGVFFRVDRGGGFEVRTPHGRARVTGTCFRVADLGDATTTNEDEMRAKWFGAGVISAVMAVTVYEGGVRVASGQGTRAEVQVRPGERAVVERDGALRREAANDHAATATGAATTTAAPATAPATAASAGDAGAAAEVVRLRTILAQNGISPETGRRVEGARRGLDDPGETDLTPDEWRQLAGMGELRYRIPGSTRGDSLDDERARRLGVPEQDRAEVNESFRAAQRELQTSLAALYREAVGSDPGNLSLEALMNELRDKAPDGARGQVTWQLAQERGGLSPWRAPSAEQPEYERAMRTLVGYEADLERRLAAIVGPRIAHDMLHGPSSVSAHAYGMRGSAPGGR
jgi:hypothetical protein